MRICFMMICAFLFSHIVSASELNNSELIRLVRPVAETPTLNHVFQAVPAPGPVAMDGDLKDWDMSGAVVITNSIEEPRRLVRVAAMYDKDGLYLAFQFKDKTPMSNHINPDLSRGRAWCGDCVQLRINTGPYPDQAPKKPLQLLHIDAYWYTEGAKATAYAVYGELSPGGKVEKTIDEAEGKGIRSAYKKDADGLGYVQELFLDWKILRPENGTPFKAGETMHLALEPMWNTPEYKDQPAVRVTDLLNPQRVERDMIWANPMAWGTLEFMDHGKLEPTETGKLWDGLVKKFGEIKDELSVTAAANAAPAVDRPCLSERNDVEKKLNVWYEAKTAAGNKGDFYDNRDREHSAIDRKAFPQVKSFEYTPEQKLENKDYAVFLGVRTCVSFGNSSTAAPPDRGGCNPRFALMNPGGILQLYAQYRGNNLYFYPAHHDYHPGHNGHGFWGDVLPVNCPYYLLSRGSSGSDIPFLNATIHASAAFSPEVKKLLVEQGLLMPTIQYILRSAYKANASPEDYFTGKAHPAVFEGSLLDELKMIGMAHDMTPDTVPPLSQIKVSATDPLVPGVNAPSLARGELLCESPSATGFVFRRWDRCLKLDASAASSFDLQKKPLTFKWALLQGIPERVKIEPYENGSKARISVAWHDRFPVQPGSNIQTNRVDIGLFASNGKSWSAPAIISIVCPDNELRTYDDSDRLIDVQYVAMDTAIGYDTNCVIPAEGVPPYDIRDWNGLMKMLASSDASLCGKLSDKYFTVKEREAIAIVSASLAEMSSKIEVEQKASSPASDLNRRWIAARQDSEKLSKLLFDPVPAINASAKDRIEGMLNAWQDNPSFYLDNRAAFDELLAKSPKDVQDKIVEARNNLVKLGIYRQEGDSWKLQAIYKGNGTEADRLTLAERSELKRFHLLLETQLILPGVLVRDPQFNYTDFRIMQAKPEWLTMQYNVMEMKPGAVNVRGVASPPKPKTLEDP